jgi:D-xylose transport system substrate-binding protein
MRYRFRGRAIALVAVAALVMSACGDDDDPDTTGTTAAEDGGSDGGEEVSGTIALLLPESQTARYETQDRPLFEAKVDELCPDCEVLYSNADQDAAKQLSQAEAALTNGAEVLVLDPVDGEAAGAIVAQAAAQDVPVISYDRLILDAEVDLYISFDNEKVGELQATALIDKLEADGVTEGDLIMINGSPTDNNATLFKDGAHSVIDASGFTVAAESDTVEWKPDNAQDDMDGHITTVGADNIVGVYAANDGTAGGAIAAMKAAGIDPLPPITGQDAEVAAIQRILAGEQFMTVYKAIKLEAEAAAEAAVAMLRGEEPAGADDTVDNGAIDVPSILLEPVPVTAENVADTVIADGFWTVEDICTGDFVDACAAAEIE